MLHAGSVSTKDRHGSELTADRSREAVSQACASNWWVRG